MCDRDQEDMYRLVISEVLCVTESKRTYTVCDQGGVVCDRDQEDMYRL